MSSKRRLRRKMCDGKKKFTDQAAAINHATYNTRRHKTLITAYKCRYCGGWHVGHPPYRVRQSFYDKLRNKKGQAKDV